MSNPRTVLLITPFFSPNVGGVETRFDNITDYLDRNGYRVWVQTYQPIVSRGARGPRHEKRGQRAEIWRTWWPGGDRFHRLLNRPALCALYLCPGLFWKCFWFLLKRKREIDVVHAPGLNSALIASVLKRLFGVPFVVSIHALYEWQPGSSSARTVKRVLSGASKVLALSDRSRRNILELGVPPDLVGIHTNWIDVNLFRPLNKQDCKKKLKLDGKFVVMMVGRLRKIKGVGLVIELARKIEDDNIRVVVVGEGELAGTLREEAGINQRLVFLDLVPNCEMPEVYNAADIGLVPSLYDEGFSRVVIENLCCGVPLIASRKGCIPEEVTDETAILIEPSTETLLENVLALYRNKQRLEKMSVAARALGENRYSEKNMDTIIAAYEAAVKKA